jgi:ATP-dependent Zn protease
MIDDKVKEILDESFERVKTLLLDKETELRNLSKNLFWYDYLDQHEMEKVIRGEELPKEKVRTWDYQKEGEYIIKF